MTSAEEIARGLTKAQRRWLNEEAFRGRGMGVDNFPWMTMPPRNTHDVLIARGLARNTGALTPLGIEVRKILESRHDH